MCKTETDRDKQAALDRELHGLAPNKQLSQHAGVRVTKRAWHMIPAMQRDCVVESSYPRFGRFNLTHSYTRGVNEVTPKHPNDGLTHDAPTTH